MIREGKERQRREGRGKTYGYMITMKRKNIQTGRPSTQTISGDKKKQVRTEKESELK